MEYDEEESPKLCQEALDAGIDAYSAIMDGLAAGMDTVGDLYDQKEYFVPELLLCSDAMYAGLEVLKPHVKTDEHQAAGKIIMGVVEGDIHDIGKTLVKTMFEAAGWEIYDLGKDVKLERFVEELHRTGADVVALSALMNHQHDGHAQGHRNASGGKGRGRHPGGRGPPDRGYRPPVRGRRLRRGRRFRGGGRRTPGPEGGLKPFSGFCADASPPMRWKSPCLPQRPEAIAP